MLELRAPFSMRSLWLAHLMSSNSLCRFPASTFSLWATWHPVSNPDEDDSVGCEVCSVFLNSLSRYKQTDSWTANGSYSSLRSLSSVRSSSLLLENCCSHRTNAFPLCFKVVLLQQILLPTFQMKILDSYQRGFQTWEDIIINKQPSLQPQWYRGQKRG